MPFEQLCLLFVTAPCVEDGASPGERRWKALQSLVCGDPKRLRQEIRISQDILKEVARRETTSEMVGNGQEAPVGVMADACCGAAAADVQCPPPSNAW